MSFIHDQLSERFYKWESRGRGWKVFDEPVEPEPPFLPFPGHFIPETTPVDDGRRPTLLSSLVQRLSRKLSTEAAAPPLIPEPEEQPEPSVLIRDSLVELQTSLPANLNISKDVFEQFLSNVSLCREPLTFELVGTSQGVVAQFAGHQDDAPSLRRQLQAHFPEATFQSKEGTLENAWDASTGDEVLVVEFGLEREFMFPLATSKLDPFVGIIGALAELQPGELGLFQVIFQPAQQPWDESIVRSVCHADGKPFFVNSPELADAAKQKVAKPLYGVVVRICVRSERQERTLQMARDLAGSLRVFSHPHGNALIPLANDDYPFEDHIEDALRRQSRRSGMLLNTDELIGFVHLPSSAVRSPALKRETSKTKAAPQIVRQSSGVLLGHNIHAGVSVPVRLSAEQRVQHVHVIGASGTGKSTLLFNLIRSDIENGAGVAVLDPHGDLVDAILGIIPPERIRDVVLVDPSDETHAVGFNILSAHSELEKTLLASDLVSIFRRLSTTWGDQMDSVLRNAILAFLESDRRGTLHDLRRFLIEPSYRADFLTSVQDSNVVYYWLKEFPYLTGNKSIGPVLTRLNDFLSRKPIRHMVAQPENRLDFGHIMDSGKIFLAKLSHGLLGEENAYLLGSLFVSKFQQLAMSRQAQQASLRRNYWLVLDEFANFITPSMGQILTGARKYRLGLVLAHHDLKQLQREPEVASLVLSGPYTRICFRVGDDDARKLGDSLSYFEPRDLQNLGQGEAVVRVERNDYDFNLRVTKSDEPDAGQASQTRQAVIESSREQYAKLRSEIEATLKKELESAPEKVVAKPEKKLKPAPTAVATPPPLPEQPIVAHQVAPAVTTPLPEPPVVSTQPPIPPPIPKVVEPLVHAELPKSTVSERKTPDMGRGGAQHQAIQKRIKEAAEALGFRSVIEKPVLDGQGSVDLWLERPGQAIACEISISTTIDHEVGNVEKCLKAGVPKVAVICLDESRLRKIGSAVSGSLGSELAARVEYFQPDPFIAHLKALKPPEPQPTETTYAGYKIKRSIPKLSSQEQKQKEDIANRIMADAMRRK
ncbi:MAG: type IV secretion system DNA-binding domain-containing protein [Verrucomicrobia bacterium]|nr:type IV secretion system DNA-binding domain-containing protein [Verrucomicrobiota bacterium]